MGEPSAPPQEHFYPQLGGGLQSAASQPYVPQAFGEPQPGAAPGFIPPQPQMYPPAPAPEQKVGDPNFAPFIPEAPMEPMASHPPLGVAPGVAPHVAPGLPHAAYDPSVHGPGEGEGEGPGEDGEGSIGERFFERELMSNENVDILLQPEGAVQIIEHIQMLPTLVPLADASFNARVDATQISKVLGFFNSAATTQRKLVEILGNRSTRQRQNIVAEYSAQYKRSLVRDVTSNGSVRGPFQELMRALLEQPAAYQARWLNWALRKNDIRFLILLMCTSTPEELGMVKQAFELEYRQDLIALIKQQTTQWFGLHTKNIQKFLLHVAQEERQPTSFYVDQALVEQDAQQLKRASEGADLDKDVFIEIFSLRSLPHLAQVALAYNRIASAELVDVIKAKFKESSETGYACMVTLYFASRRYDLYADMFGKALKNPGPQLEFLTRLIVRHCEWDLGNVLNMYGVEKFQFYLRSTHETGNTAVQRWVELVRIICNLPA